MAREREKRRREILSTKVFRLYLVDDNIDASCEAVKTEKMSKGKEKLGGHAVMGGMTFWNFQSMKISLRFT